MNFIKINHTLMANALLELLLVTAILILCLPMADGLLQEKPRSVPSTLSSDVSSGIPSNGPSDIPSDASGDHPSALPSAIPSDLSSSIPSTSPSVIPSNIESGTPSNIPSDLPSNKSSDVPSLIPSIVPSSGPSDVLSLLPSDMPSDASSDHPSALPSTASSPNPEVVNLGTAGNFAILSKSGVTTTGLTSVTGDMGTSPIAGTALTGFGLVADSSNTFSTSNLVTGNIYAADYGSDTPAMLTVAVLDMQAAYVDAAGRPSPDHTELGAGSIEGLTLERGIYKWSTNVGFTDSVTFHGSPTDVWIMQTSGSLIVDSGARMILTGGAKAENIFWQIAGQTTLGTTSHVEGVFLCQTSITFQTGSSMNGAALAQTAVTIDSATIVKKSVCDADVGCEES
mmetsp:Transcript_26978/g.25838  ORF Transcript_26978/g.25838 Transcript_26978/m.25838 type:complete len:397 (-) Transcript_26978:109-1299(-)